MTESKTTEITISAEYADEIARKIHYPECWDTACYPTLADAVIEIATSAGCSEHPVPKVQNFGPARKKRISKTEVPILPGWWESWKKPDGTACTKIEVLRAFAQMRRKNRIAAKFINPDQWLRP